MDARQRLAEARLYGILDLGYVADADLEWVADQLMTGGCGVLQLRAKGYDESRISELAARVRPVCARHGVPLVINDFPAVAAAAGADGVHVGQDDGSLDEVRRVVGPGMIVGRSTHSLAQAVAAVEEGFDYLGFGPLFPTPTKQGRPGIGLDDVAEAQRLAGSRVPMFCIGGIKPDNLPAVIAAGARRVVIVSALLQAKDITAGTREAKAMLG
jgi:thiamine-phosphate pyrophosphorylase